MRRWFVFTLLVAALSAAPSGATGLRFELGERAGEGLPGTYQELERRVARLGWTVVWSDPVRFEPYFSTQSGAEIATIAVEVERNETVTFTWASFPSVAAANGYVVEMGTAFGPGGWVDHRQDGALIVQAYSDSGDRAIANAALSVLAAGGR